MNKWLIRILGVMILVILGLFFFQNWFAPKVPRQLQQGLVSDHRPDGEDKPQGKANDPAPRVDQGKTAEEATESKHGDIHLLSLETLANDKNTPSPFIQQIPPTDKSEANEVRRQMDRAQQIGHTASLPNVDNAWVQAGSFGDRENAEQLADILEKQDMPTVIESVTVNDKRYNRLYVGPLREDEIDSTLRRLSAMGIDARRISRDQARENR